MTVLVLGGAGYIGSHAVCRLHDGGYDIVVADNLSTGHKEAVKYGKFYQGDVRDKAFLDTLFSENKIDAVMNFCAMSLVGESVSQPLQYYHNNVYGAICLLEKMVEYGVKTMVFSSTAAVYGEPEVIPILEEDLTLPSNPYGDSKLAVERLLKWCANAYDFRYASLRYFNVAGADYERGIGEAHANETHLIPIVLQVALGGREKIQIFGNDYSTPDGTCVRDYIDVRDLCDAHVLALEYLVKGGESQAFNLGNGNGFSVLEVIEAARAVTGHTIPQEIAPRRPGDPDRLVASSELAREILDWQPRHASIGDMISSAWHWHKSYPEGFSKK